MFAYNVRIQKSSETKSKNIKIAENINKCALQRVAVVSKYARDGRQDSCHVDGTASGCSHQHHSIELINAARHCMDNKLKLQSL